MARRMEQSQIMAASDNWINNLEEYVVNSTEAVDFKLVRKREDIDDPSTSFEAEMTHQVFGDKELIFGYKDLKIQLYYTAGSLNIYAGYKYGCQIDDVMHNSNIKADPIISKIEEILPDGCAYYTNIDEFLSTLKRKFTPMGEKICELTDPDTERVFEFYLCDTATPNFVQYFGKLQTFVLFYIDAASYISLDDSSWMFFVCFERYKNDVGDTCYASVGYTTVYRFYSYPDKLRPRISQVLVLPPFRNNGLASKMIEIIYEHFKGDPKVTDITCEAPTPQLQRIRYYVCAKLLKELPEFSVEKVNKGLLKDMTDAAKTKYKIHAQHTKIVYEILRLMYLNRNDEDEYKKYRLMVKNRLNLNYYKLKEDAKKVANVAGVSLDTQLFLRGLPSIKERSDQLRSEYKLLEVDYDTILKRLTDL